MTAHNQSCAELPLNLLLTTASEREDSSGQYRTMTDHVGQCETCQMRLSELAADRGFWNDTHALLSDSLDYEWKPDATWSSLTSSFNSPRHASSESAALERLGTPRHPEMLGRLGRYDIERVIGSGGMGIVLKAHDSELNRPIAIKLLAPHLAHVGAARERFAREGRAAAAVVHEHVVSIHNVETDGETPFLVMQYVPGRSLQARVDADGPLAVEEILRIGLQAASGLAAAHAQGLVHRDVKPANILLEETVERVVLTDFGLARAVDDASLTQTGVLAGTPHYMSPEQAMGASIDHRSDLFSLGAVLYFMATGHPPFRAEGALAVLHRICREPHRPVWQHNLDVPDELGDVIDRLLEKKPGKRFSSAAEVESRLVALLSRVQQFGYRRRRLPSLRRWATRRNILGATLVLLVLIAAVIKVPAFWPQRAGVKHASEVSNSAAIVDSNRRFVSDVAESQQAINRAEQPSVFLRSGNDPWYREMEALRRDVDRLEAQN